MWARNALRALEVAARAALPQAGLHTLRHSPAGVMLIHGVPLKVVSEILGHSSIAITGDVCGHVAPDVSRKPLPCSAPSSAGKGGQDGGRTIASAIRGRYGSLRNGP